MDLCSGKLVSMDKVLISDKQYYLSVGIFTIHLSNSSLGTDYYLPERAEQFLCSTDRSDNNTCKIKYIIELYELFEEPKDTPIDGFDDSPYPYRIYQLDGKDYLWIRKNKFDEIKYVYQISHDWSTWQLIVDHSGSQGIDSFTELAYIFAYSILNKGGILFHGVVMDWLGFGIIVCAHSGVGKTTHTRMWRDNENAVILNGDRALCCKEDNRWYTYGAPWSGSSGENKNCRVALRAIVILEQAVTNQVIALTPLQGAMELMQLTFAPQWEEDLINCSLNSIDSISQSIPLYKLKCRPDLEAVAALKSELENLLKA